MTKYIRPLGTLSGDKTSSCNFKIYIMVFVHEFANIQCVCMKENRIIHKVHSSYAYIQCMCMKEIRVIHKVHSSYAYI